METLEVFKKGNNKGKAYICKSIRLEGNEWKDFKFVMVENAEGFIDFPIRYANGTIAYDFPERLPSYLKELAKQALDKLDEMNNEKA